MSVPLVLVVERRPETMNAYRTVHHFERARIDRSWRETFAYLALSAKPRRRWQTGRVVVRPICRPGTTMPDVAACYPAAKAAIDGIVDAGVLPDDKPEHLLEIRFVAPIRGERDALRIDVEEGS